MSSILSSNNSAFKIVYTDNDMYGLCDGDYYFDTRDNRYYIYYRMGSIEIINTLSSALNTFSSNCYVNDNSISYSSMIYDREILKEYLKNDPELLNELLCEIRKEKIQKILNK